MKKISPIPSPQHVWIHYDAKLALITGVSHESATVSKGCWFGRLMSGILATYPKINTRYPPESGLLAFALNKVAPEVDTKLKDGDVISLWIYDEAWKMTSQ